MTKLIIESDDTWTREKINFSIDVEIHLFKKAAYKIKDKFNSFEKTHGPLDRNKMYGKVDDMVLVEWEGEIESLRRVQRKLKSLEDINFEYR